MKKHYLKVLLGFLGCSVASILVLLSPLVPVYQGVVLLKDGQFPHLSENGRQFIIKEGRPLHWVKLRSISQRAIDAIVISEDWGFFNHGGVDWPQVEKAIRDWLFKGKKLRGASTIDQQVIKNLFFSSKRSYRRKILEIFAVRILGASLSKVQILELYLNIAQLGENIRGVSQASEYYFEIPAWRLSIRQGAFLAMLLPSPVRYAQSFRERKLSPYALEQIHSIVLKMKMAKMISPQERLGAMSEKFSWEVQSAEVIDQLGEEGLRDEDEFFMNDSP